MSHHVCPTEGTLAPPLVVRRHLQLLDPLRDFDHAFSHFMSRRLDYFCLMFAFALNINSHRAVDPGSTGMTSRPFGSPRAARAKGVPARDQYSAELARHTDTTLRVGRRAYTPHQLTNRLQGFFGFLH